MTKSNKRKKPKSDLLLQMQTYLTKVDLKEIDKLSLSEVDAWVDKYITRKKAKRDAMPKPPRKTLPKWLRPKCNARCRSLGHRQCRATPVWNKKLDKPVNGKCRVHGGLSKGATTPEGKEKSWHNLWQNKPNPVHPTHNKQKLRNQLILFEIEQRAVHGQRLRLYEVLAASYGISTHMIRYIVDNSNNTQF